MKKKPHFLLSKGTHTYGQGRYGESIDVRGALNGGIQGWETLKDSGLNTHRLLSLTDEALMPLTTRTTASAICDVVQGTCHTFGLIMHALQLGATLYNEGLSWHDGGVRGHLTVVEVDAIDCKWRDGVHLIQHHL